MGENIIQCILTGISHAASCLWLVKWAAVLAVIC